MSQTWSISYPDGVRITREKYEAMLREVLAAREMRDFCVAVCLDAEQRYRCKTYDKIRKQNEENGI